MMAGMHRDDRLRKLAREKPCMVEPATVGIYCTWRHDKTTVVWAHSNLEGHGKGERLKAHDCFGFLACYSCHTLIDQGHSLTRDARRRLQVEAMGRTREYLAKRRLIVGATPADLADDIAWLEGWLAGRITVAKGAR
jgi:hypothetical protein